VDRRVDISANPEPRVPLYGQFRDFFRRNALWFLVAGLALLLIQDIFGNHGVLAMRRSQQQSADMQKEIDQLNEENQRLRGNIKSLKSDPSAIERIARQEMGLQRPGEFVFKTTPDSADSKPSAAPPQRPPSQPSPSH